MLNTPEIENLICSGNISDILKVMTRKKQGMQTIEQDMNQLFNNGPLSYKDASQQ
jgi:Tfp pilus assembly ATPase PilU